MRPILARPLWAAVLTTAVLGGLLIAYALDSTLPPYTLVSAAAGVAAGAAAIVMALRDPFPARLAAGVLCATGALAAVLAMSVGVPGDLATGLTLRGAALVACGLLVPVLLAVHVTSGPHRTEGRGSYAP
jgi:TRAP-type mannitol/chloroaromatic compound transport system permease large subunit